MAIVPPIPYDLLLNAALPGLTQNLHNFGFTAIGWDRAPLQLRIQTLDDAVGLLNTRPERHFTLIRTAEQAIQELMVGKPSERGPVSFRALLHDLSQTLRILIEEGAGSVSHRPALERSRLVTLALNQAENPGVFLRGPAHLLRVRRPGSDLMEEFGRTVLAAWGQNRDEARQTFWAKATPLASESPMEIQAFASSRQELDLKLGALAERGFEVRSAPIPADVSSRPGRPAKDPTEVVHWIVARRGQTPLETWFRTFIDHRDHLAEQRERETEERTGAKSRFPISQLDVLDRTNVPSDDPQLEADLHSLFGRPVSLRDIRKGFAIDVPRYGTQRLSIKKHDGDGVSIVTEITTQKGETAARLSGWLKPPPAGQPWIAWGEDLNETLYSSVAPESILRHLSQGIGRRSLMRILVFLHRLGVNALDMRARGHGLTFMPYIGFDFQDEKTRQRILSDFVRYVKVHDASPSERTLRDLQQVRHAWDIVEFQNDRGEPVGREFLTDYSQSRRGVFSLRFRLDSAYPGWSRLFSRDLALHPELDEEESQESTDSQRSAGLLMEKAAAIASSSPPINLQRPLEERRRESDTRGIIAHLLEELEQARTNADLDPLTKLMNRRSFLKHNRDLEQSYAANRKGDGGNDHWVLMLDIDHFKAVNTNYGHDKGDEALRRVAQIIKDSVRDGDLTCRWGGEEFAVVLKNSGFEGMKRVTENIRQKVMSSPLDVGGGKIHPLTISTGAVPFRVIAARRKSSGQFNPHEEEPASVETSLTASLKDADEKLYEAKDADPNSGHPGRNRVVYLEPSVKAG